MERFLELLNTFKERAIDLSNHKSFGTSKRSLVRASGDFYKANESLVSYVKERLKRLSQLNQPPKNIP